MTEQPIEHQQVIKSQINSPWIIILHILVILFAWLSPFLLRWPLIVLGIVLYYYQILFWGRCLLTKWQFNQEKRGETFYNFILSKLGFRYRVRYLGDYIIPGFILGLAFLLQLGFRLEPIII